MLFIEIKYTNDIDYCIKLLDLIYDGNFLYLCLSCHHDNNIKYMLAKFICDKLCIKTWIRGMYSCSYYDTGYYLQNKYIESRKYRKFFRSIRINYGQRIVNAKQLEQLVEKEKIIITNYKTYINNVYNKMLEQIDNYRLVVVDITNLYDNLQKSLSYRAEQYDCEEKLLQSIYNMTARPNFIIGSDSPMIEHALSQMYIMTTITMMQPQFPSVDFIAMKLIYEKLRKNDTIISRMYRYAGTNVVSYLSLTAFIIVYCK